MTANDLSELARRVDEAARDASAIPQLTKTHDLGVSEAYEIQALAIERRLSRGERLIGMKMGLTSRVKMQQVGVHEMIWGRLTSAMLVEDGESIERSRFIHPRAEPEVAFLLKAPLSGKVSPLQALAAVEAVAPAIEIIDSRYENFRFTLEDVVADNCSSSAFVVGPFSTPDTDVSNLGMVLEVNGRVRETGSSAAILGHPLRSLAAASRLLAEQGLRLEPGWIVMAGGATAATPLAAGDAVRASVEKLGRVSFRVEP